MNCLYDMLHSELHQLTVWPWTHLEQRERGADTVGGERVQLIVTVDVSLQSSSQ